MPSNKGVTLKTELYPELLKGVMDLAGVLGIDEDTLDKEQPPAAQSASAPVIVQVASTSA
jgi:hypothetical protein